MDGKSLLSLREQLVVVVVVWSEEKGNETKRWTVGVSIVAVLATGSCGQ